MNFDLLTRFLNKATHYHSHQENLRNQFIGHMQHQKAAVLIAIIWHEQQWQVLLTRRSTSLRQHTGQISLLGGRKEQKDKDFTETALREAEEEIGIPTSSWHTFPELPPHYTPSGYQVYPIPAIYQYPNTPTLSPNPDEVAEAFYVPLKIILNPNSYQSRLLHHHNQSINAPSLIYQHYDIWGLTAIILYSLAERYQIYIQDD